MLNASGPFLLCAGHGAEQMLGHCSKREGSLAELLQEAKLYGALMYYNQIFFQNYNKKFYFIYLIYKNKGKFYIWFIGHNY
jgi:hypothetical protein